MADCFLSTGEVGNASKMNLVLQVMAGVTLAGLAEGMALADRAGLQQKDVMEIMELTSLACPLMIEKGKGQLFFKVFDTMLYNLNSSYLVNAAFRLPKRKKKPGSISQFDTFIFYRM